MENESPTTHSTKRNWTGRALLVIAAIVIIGAAAAAVYRLDMSPCTIVVNGKPVANVESRSAAKKVLAEARNLRSHGAPSDAMRFADRVTIRSASANAELSDLPEAVRSLEKAAAVEADLYAINVGGAPLAALRSKTDAGRALELVKQHYEKGLKNLVGQSTFQGDVYIEKRYINADKFYKTPEDACRVLTDLSEPAMTHTVERGDRAVHLVTQYGLTTNELKSLNPGVNLDRLTEGDELVVRRAKHPITVISKSMETKTVDITPPSGVSRYSGARTGKRVMRVMVTYENGSPASREVVSQLTTWDRPKSSYSEDGKYSRTSRRHYRKRQSN